MPTMREQPRRRSREPRRGRRRDNQDQSTARRHFVAASGEFVGTFLFLLFAFLGHVMAATQSGESGPGGTASSQQVVFISLSYGFSLLVTAWTLYRVSGGLFNPAVTLGMVVSGSLPAMRGLFLFPAQILGGICAAAVVNVIIPDDIAIVRTTLAPGMNLAQGVFLEMFLTSQLVLTILILAAEKSKDTFLAPIGIGLALFVVEIAGVYYTGASVNPARSFGPCVAAASFESYHWIYWVGPALGGLLAAGYYRFVKWMNYGDIGEANPGQDSAGGEFNAEIEEVRSRKAEEGQASQPYQNQTYQPQSQYAPNTHYASRSPQRWSSGQQPRNSWNEPAPPPPTQTWRSNATSEYNRRSGDRPRF